MIVVLKGLELIMSKCINLKEQIDARTQLADGDKMTLDKKMGIVHVTKISLDGIALLVASIVDPRRNKTNSDEDN